MIGFFGRVGQASTYVVRLEVGVIGEYVRLADASRQQIEHILDADAHAANAWPSAALVGIEGDAVHHLKLSFA